MRSLAPRPHLPITKHWTLSIQSALLHAIGLAQYALAYTRTQTGNDIGRRFGLAIKTNSLQQEIALLREEIRLKDARMARVPACQRPHYQPTERLAILELRAARAWSLAQTGNVFRVTPATVASWTKRLDEEGPDALLRTREPVNKFPQFVHYLVQRLQTLCPLLGKVKIAQILARAGLHLGVTTVGRMRRQQPVTAPSAMAESPASGRRVTAKRPNHVWHIDLTVVPTAAGFWVSWLPFALPQCWPFCWWLAVVIDHCSRRALGMTAFKRQPSSKQIRRFLAHVIAGVGTSPKHLITDCGKQFISSGFQRWCRRCGIQHRHGAVGKTGGIAVVERFIRTLKDGCTRVLAVVPTSRQPFLRELRFFADWYNTSRPHMTLKAATPDEVYFGRRPACRTPRFEPRASWPRGSPCARPRTLVKGQPGTRLDITVEFVAGRRHLPRVALQRAA